MNSFHNDLIRSQNPDLPHEQVNDRYQRPNLKLDEFNNQESPRINQGAGRYLPNSRVIRKGEGTGTQSQGPSDVSPMYTSLSQQHEQMLRAEGQPPYQNAFQPTVFISSKSGSKPQPQFATTATRQPTNTFVNNMRPFSENVPWEQLQYANGGMNINIQGGNPRNMADGNGGRLLIKGSRLYSKNSQIPKKVAPRGHSGLGRTSTGFRTQTPLTSNIQPSTGSLRKQGGGFVGRTRPQSAVRPQQAQLALSSTTGKSSAQNLRLKGQNLMIQSSSPSKTFGVGAASVPHNQVGKEHMLLYATSGQINAVEQAVAPSRANRYDDEKTGLSSIPNYIGSQTVLDNYQLEFKEAKVLKRVPTAQPYGNKSRQNRKFLNPSINSNLISDPTIGQDRSSYMAETDKGPGGAHFSFSKDRSRAEKIVRVPQRPITAHQPRKNSIIRSGVHSVANQGRQTQGNTSASLTNFDTNRISQQKSSSSKPHPLKSNKYTFQSTRIIDIKEEGPDNSLGQRLSSSKEPQPVVDNYTLLDASNHKIFSPNFMNATQNQITGQKIERRKGKKNRPKTAALQRSPTNQIKEKRIQFLPRQSSIGAQRIEKTKSTRGFQEYSPSKDLHAFSNKDTVPQTGENASIGRQQLSSKRILKSPSRGDRRSPSPDQGVKVKPQFSIQSSSQVGFDPPSQFQSFQNVRSVKGKQLQKLRPDSLSRTTSQQNTLKRGEQSRSNVLIKTRSDANFKESQKGSPHKSIQRSLQVSKTLLMKRAPTQVGESDPPLKSLREQLGSHKDLQQETEVVKTVEDVFKTKYDDIEKSHDESRFTFPDESQLGNLQPHERQQFLKSFKAGMSFNTKQMNVAVESHMAFFKRIDDKNSEVNNPQMKKWAQYDTTSELKQASKTIKTIQFKCHNTIVKEKDKIVDLEVREQGDWTRGDPKQIDIIENCTQICRVPIKDRKAPLKLHISFPEYEKEVIKSKKSQVAEQYWQNIGKSAPALALMGGKGNGKKRPKTAKAKKSDLQNMIHVNPQSFLVPQLPDLKIFVSQIHKDPSATKSSQQFINPTSKIIVRNIKEETEEEIQAKLKSTKQQQAQQPIINEETFKRQYLYISLTSQKGCSLSLSVAFPNEEVKSLHVDVDSLQRPTQVQIREKFKQQIEAKIEEFDANPEAYKKFVKQLKVMKKNYSQLGHNQTDKNFVEENITVQENMDTRKFKKTMIKMKLADKLEQVRQRRETQEKERLEKAQFDMVKWDLYRLRVDQIEDDYADFKRNQKRIMWWLQIILRHLSVERTLQTFYAHRDVVTWHQVRWWKHFRISWHFRRFLTRLGPSKPQRDFNHFRGAARAMCLALRDTAGERAKRIMLVCLAEQAEQWYMKADFRAFYEKMVRIQKAIRMMREQRETRLMVLDGYFDKEKNIMIKYYSEKSKKMKKFKQTVASLQSLDVANKYSVLRVYYFNKISSQNMINAIYYHANICMQRGDRGRPNEPTYGLLTDQEHRSLKTLFRNIKSADTYLFKGTKDTPAVGVDDQAYQSPTKGLQMSDKKTTLQSDGLDFASLLAIPGSQSKAKGEKGSPAQEDESRNILMGGGQFQDAEKQAASAAKSKPKGKSTSKGRTGTSSSPNRKGGKKKKSKDDDVDLDWAIPAGRSRGFNLFRPDRATMQRLITRAAGLKEKDKEPICEEVAPWLRVQNLDLGLGREQYEAY